MSSPGRKPPGFPVQPVSFRMRRRFLYCKAHGIYEFDTHVHDYGCLQYIFSARKRTLLLSYDIAPSPGFDFIQYRFWAKGPPPPHHTAPLNISLPVSPSKDF